MTEKDLNKDLNDEQEPKAKAGLTVVIAVLHIVGSLFILAAVGLFYNLGGIAEKIFGNDQLVRQAASGAILLVGLMDHLLMPLLLKKVARRQKPTE